MTAAFSRTHRGLLPFRALLKYGIAVLVLLVVGYLIYFYSLPPCAVTDWQEHVSSGGTFTVTEYTSCFYTRIRVVNNHTGKVIDDLAAYNWNTRPYNRGFSCPCSTRFVGWGVTRILGSL
jgi:hypothetical protein